MRLTVKQAAEYLNMTENSLYQLCHRKRIAHYRNKATGRLEFDTEDLVVFRQWERVEVEVKSK